MNNWQPYRCTVHEVAQKLSTNLASGLTGQDVENRFQKYGPNRLPEQKPESLIWVFLRQFQNPLIYILVAAAVIIFFLGDHLDGFIISGVLMFNAILGTVQEGRTRTLLADLQRFITSHAVVIRDGVKRIIPDEQLVVGDVIVLQEGTRVPADARIVSATSLQIDQAVLTGESEGVFKHADAMPADVPVADRANMVYKGTYVLAGLGTAVVVATGTDSEIGRLHLAVEGIKTDMPLAQELERLSYWVLIFIFLSCGFLLGIGLLFGKSFTELLVMLTALFICVIPEGLPVVLTLVLVTGAYRMAKQRVLIKRLRAVDTLGRTQVILIDKTGTLTRNEMMVTRAYVDGQMLEVSGLGYYAQGDVSMPAGQEVPPRLEELVHAARLLDHSQLTYDEQTKLFAIEGDPTEAALGVFAQKAGAKLQDLKQRYRLLYEIPFHSALKYHVAFFEHDTSGIAYIIGSPEVVMKKSADVSAHDKQTLQDLLSRGLRVVAVATKQFDISTLTACADDEARAQWAHAFLEGGLSFLGLCGIQDAIRPNIASVVQQTRDAGISVVMVTGDHKKTAEYVANEVGILRPGDTVVDGKEFDELSDDQLAKLLPTTTVFSRVTPEDKLKIVQRYNERGLVTTMTGDGVNDVPSLVAADCGIAMGSIGTEVAKQAADVILLDDSFANIIAAVRQGRHIFYALYRVILYFFATNMGEILVVLFALSLNFPIPILAAQILWLNLVTDGFLDVALAMEQPEKDILQRSWLARGARLIDARLMLKTLYMALPMGIGSLAIFNWYWPIDLVKARTMTLVTMAMYQWFNAWNCRSMTRSVFEIGLFSNRWLIAATTLVACLQLLVVYHPWFQFVFKTVPLTWHEFGIILLVTVPIFIIEEVRKFFVRRWYA